MICDRNELESLIEEGYTCLQIAQKLDIHYTTVNKYVKELDRRFYFKLRENGRRKKRETVESLKQGKNNFTCSSSRRWL